ncbi:patatin-like phospholipase/acyl hydrolase [Natranaerovirga hydrolytica]|uniref:Patatin-like phospholipase/acyl hydrolase n=1 Tax=Natranaerovirga hydrolytica TaxID=680378 RepID=A0A4R1MZ03_9FIRM|nr:CBASS cGAMP-activated phospholipase [Natranaerovirga hydrolytica]TCK98547.1 patatin-like phospholipase/acyl hydrolase [Natranaerovirga hydrolytica]
MSEKQTIFMLSIDGGGVRGIIPALILQAISDELNQKPLYKYFDLVAGTSTGALISLLLSAPKLKNYTYRNRAKLIVDLYEQQSHLIFDQSRQTLKKISQLFKPKYNPTTFEAILEEYFQDLTLHDSLTNLIIPVFDMHKMKPFFFKHRPNFLYNESDLNFYLKDVALASTSAPTYFPPHYITPTNGYNSYCFVDGGLYANNPSLCAYTEARKIYPEAKEYICLSIGTGKVEKSFLCKDVRNWGLVGWVNPFNRVPLVSSFMYSQEESVNHMLSRIPKSKLYRLNPTIYENISDLDNASVENINQLKELTLKYIEDNKAFIKKIADKLSQ